MSAAAGIRPGGDDLAGARRWIGRCLRLREGFNCHAPGTRCVVTCVVDFGDGLLLWVATDDHRLEEVDQIAVGELGQRFEVLAPVRPRLVRGLAGRAPAT